MKRITWVLFLVLPFALSVNAQNSEFSKFSLGIKAGVNISNMKVSGQGISVISSSLTRFVGGIYGEYKFSNMLGIQPELIYNGLGAKSSGTKDQFAYLSIPVLFKYSIPNIGLALYAGPQISLLLSAKEKIDSISTSADIKNQMKNSEISGVIGVDYTFNSGVSISARYQLGFSNVVKDIPSGYSMKNNAFGITVGYKIR
jgi:hypothetical protein